MARFLQFKPWSLDEIPFPWQGQALYEIVKESRTKVDLPEPRKGDENELRWAPGALDGITGHHFAEAEASEVHRRSSELFRALRQLLKKSSQENLLALLRLSQDEPLLPVADELQKIIVAELVPRSKYKDRLAKVGRYLMTKSVDRENIKLGILLIELTGDETDRTVLEQFAVYDEFTLYATLALCRTTENAEQTLWEIAKRVRGWGRIALVERPSGTQNRQIQEWMLREGFRNDIMDEYLAGICARTGRLHEALESVEIDEPLLNGAAELIKALVNGGPADSIEDYAEAPIAVREYLRQAQRAKDFTMEHLLCVARLHQFLSEEDGWEARFSKRWTRHDRDQAASTRAELMERPKWIEMTLLRT